MEGGAGRTLQRVRPSSRDWPSDEAWGKLKDAVGGRLVKVETPLAACRQPDGADACAALFKELKNPYYIRDQVGITQTLGWIDGWTYQPSAYAVAAGQSSDVVAAVNFARERNLRLVVKGGGHSYLGTSNAPDSLLIWTRAMDAITLHDGFVAQGCSDAPQPAVSIGAGAIWMHAYNMVVTRGGRYVQGGGCGTVGVAGLVQGGGFGSFSKRYGTAAASLLEAEIVTADGSLRIANACQHPDLFWALKGGGGGTFGVVTRVTLRTHELPEFFGGVFASVQATSDAAFRKLIGRFVAFYASALHNDHWGEIVNLRRHNSFEVSMSFQGLSREQAEAIWQPFFDWLKASPADYTITSAPLVVAMPARHLWDPDFLRDHFPQAIVADDRPGASPDNIFWAGNLAEAGHVLYGFQSIWLPAALLAAERQELLADTLFAASRQHPLELHFQKGLSGASDEVIAAARDTATNPDVLSAFMLVIVAGEGPPAYPGLAGHEPNLKNARNEAAQIGRAMGELRKIAPESGSYVAESDYFESNWQHSYWGENYPRLLAIKQKYDPEGLFFVRHGVGTETWSDDGFSGVIPG
ncbi:MAG TPA: FAD-dependent oxidoreductase [Bradyrhizobium sp.]|nr:FAD-dependent oxidoreductase [Bradyrhizobium sp.]